MELPFPHEKMVSLAVLTENKSGDHESCQTIVDRIKVDFVISLKIDFFFF